MILDFSFLCYFAGDERMHHLCMWPGHREHFRESTHVFYKRFFEILAFNRLVSVIVKCTFFFKFVLGVVRNSEF